MEELNSDERRMKKKGGTWKNQAQAGFIPEGMNANLAIELAKRKEGPEVSPLGNEKKMKLCNEDCEKAGTVEQPRPDI